MKNFPLIIICLIAGVVIGYFIPRHQACDIKATASDSTSLKEQADNNETPHVMLSASQPASLQGFTETTITAAQAKNMIKLFKTQNSADIRNGQGMYSEDIKGNKNEVGGFVISRAAIENIFKTDDCNGIRIYFAKHPKYLDTKSRVFTIIFAGTKPSANKGVDSTGLDIEAPIYDHVDPCPNNCGQLFN
ncbi:hypothetical protein [Mucilaginibacter segetis]|uniref:Uncharacterized protein n=1 Tax=Mucilaginibacter segetis TaxID=2793071 RepID=A0A934PV37_9SPHI|nr:hypothetical protein [Mucilaginibacter segetis]MBK0379950.1 hypothetical protein [Mucilaginibacter segetis]